MLSWGGLEGTKAYKSMLNNLSPEERNSYLKEKGLLEYTIEHYGIDENNNKYSIIKFESPYFLETE
jgi:hypothetical protein